MTLSGSVTPDGLLPEEYSSEADFSDIDLSADGTSLLIANINQSNSRTPS